jgi:methionine-rich copper-binding protein CopC
VGQLDADVSSRALAMIGAGFGAVAMLAPARAFAHAFPIAEQPRVGSTVNKPPSQATITYDVPIESLFARLQVLDAAGHDEAASEPQVGAGRRELSVPLKPLGPGDYTVKWAVVAEDGHRTEGSYMFTVAPGASR